MALRCIKRVNQVTDIDFGAISLQLVAQITDFSAFNCTNLINILKALIFKKLVLKIFSETIDRILFSDLQNPIIQLWMLIMESVTLDCLMNELNVRSKISLKFPRNNAERIHDYDDQIWLCWLNLKNLQELMNNLSCKLSKGWAYNHFIDLFDGDLVHSGYRWNLSSRAGCPQQQGNNQVQMVIKNAPFEWWKFHHRLLSNTNQFLCSVEILLPI